MPSASVVERCDAIEKAGVSSVGVFEPTHGGLRTPESNPTTLKVPNRRQRKNETQDCTCCNIGGFKTQKILHPYCRYKIYTYCTPLNRSRQTNRRNILTADGRAVFVVDSVMNLFCGLFPGSGYGAEGRHIFWESLLLVVPGTHTHTHTCLP